MPIKTRRGRLLTKVGPARRGGGSYRRGLAFWGRNRLRRGSTHPSPQIAEDGIPRAGFEHWRRGGLLRSRIRSITTKNRHVALRVRCSGPWLAKHGLDYLRPRFTDTQGPPHSPLTLVPCETRISDRIQVIATISRAPFPMASQLLHRPYYAPKAIS